MKTRKYGAFTLVEMLIVMGILSVLMAIGVSVARFAIQRANNIQHQNAVDQMFQAMQSYYTDNRRYPTIDAGPNQFISFQDALNDAGSCTNCVLDEYVDANFDGGSPAVFYYFAPTGQYPQEFLVCVTFSEEAAAPQYGGYCNGNGFGVVDPGAGTIDQKVLEEADFDTFVLTPGASGYPRSIWEGDGWR